MPAEPRKHYQRPIEGEPDTWDPSDPQFGGFWQGGKHWSEVVGDEAVGYLQKERNQEKPFFMYVAFNAPHDPRQSPKEYVDRYPLSRMGLPENFQPAYPFAEAMGCTIALRDENLAPFPRTEHAVKVQRREYYAIITHLDTQVGRILDAIDSTGEAENTWIFFTADHGLAVGHHGLFGKQNMYDHSLRVPFMVVGPKVPAGKRIDAPIYLQDVMPTALELGGAKTPDYVEFRSLLPYLAKEGGGEKEVARRDLIYGAYMSQQRAVIHDGWKLIVYPDAPVARLYHLDADPQEMHDLAGDPEQAERKRTLLHQLQEEQRRLEDGLDLTPILSKL
jgi:choline-sulfatase